MSDNWMAMSAADLSPHKAWEQYKAVTGTPDQAYGPGGRYSWSLYAIFQAGIEYADEAANR